MKRRIKMFNERDGFDDLDDEFNDPYLLDSDMPPYNSGDWEVSEEEEEEEEDLDEEGDDDIKHLLYLIRSMFKNSGFEAQVSNSLLDIEVTIVLNRKEKLGDIVKIFELVKKLKNDYLTGFESSFELWETKRFKPMLTFFFNSEDDGDEDDDGMVAWLKSKDEENNKKK